MFKSWRKATAGSTAGRIGRGFHRVLSRVALPAVLIAALVATPLQILGDPGAVQAQDEPIAVSFRDMVYYVHEDETSSGVNVVVEVSEATDTGTTTLYLKPVQTDHAERITSLGDSVQISQGDTSGNFQVRPDNNTEADGDYPLDLMFDTDHVNWPDTHAPANPLAMARVVVIDDDSNNIQLGAFSQSVFEGTSFTVTGDPPVASNQEATWTVVLTQEPTDTVTVNISSSNPAAATVRPSTLTFEVSGNDAWNQTQEVTLTGVDDAGFTDHTVIFTHSVSGGGYDNVATRAVTVSVTDDDTPALVVSPDGVRMIEGTTAVYRVRLNGPPSSRMDVNITNPDTDRITLSTDRLVFTASGGDRWSRWRNMYITSHSDEDDLNDAVTINHVSDGRGGFEDVSATLAIFIEDDDKPGIRVSTSTATIAEDGEATWQVRLNTQPTDAVTISLASTDPDAATVSPAELTFTTRNWNSNRDVTVTGVDDGDVADERVSVSHVAVGGDYDDQDRTVLVMVEDDDKDKAGIMLSATALTVGESSTNTFGVSLVGGVPKGNVTIEVVSTDTDNVTVQPDSLTFSPLNWADAQTVTVTGVNEIGDNADDTEDETGITVMMTATAATTGDEAFNGLVTGVNITVEDDDKDGIKVSAAGVPVAEGGTATWTVQLNTDPGTNNAVEVTITSSNPDSATALPSVITFTTTAGTGTFRWDDEQTVTVTGEADSDFLPNVVYFTHAVTDGDYDVASRTVRVTTTDLESPSLILGNVEPADPDVDGSTPSLSIDEGTTRHKYTVALSHRPTGTVQVMLPNPDPDKLAISTNRLVFKRDRGDWDRARNIYVDALADEDNENDTFTITHSASGGGFDEQEVVLTLTVEDSGKAGLKLSATNLTLDEGTEGSFGVSLKTPPSAEVTVVVGGGGAGVISVEVDEPADPNAPSTLTFNSENWNEPQSVTVTAVEDDTADDESETVTLSVTSTGDTNYQHTNDNAINREVNVNVTDLDVIAMILLNQDLTPFPPSVDEGGTRVVEVYLTSEPSGQVTVAVTTDPAVVSDYATVSPNSLNFGTGAGWEDPQTITIRGVEDDTDQEDNFFGILLDSSGGGYDEVDGDFAVRIVDNDIVGIKLSTDAVTVLEGTSVVSGESGAADAEWTVQLNTDPGANNAVEVSISSSNAASATVNPEKITFTTDGVATDTVRWDTAQDVTVSGETDDDISDNVVIFTHRVSGGSYAAADAIVTVTATDTAVPALMLGNVVPADTDVTDSTPTLAIDEGTTRYKYTVALSHRPNGTVEVLMPNPDPDNLKLSTDRLVFKKDRGDWDRARNIYLDALADDNIVNDTYIITHTASGGGYDGLAVVLTLTVEDGGKAGLKLSATNLTLDEGTQGSVSVSLKTQPAADVVVTVGVTGNTDAITLNEPDDPATLTFNAGNYRDTQTVKVTANDDPDIIDGLPATVTLNVTSPDDPNYQHNDNDNPINRTVNVSVNDTDSAGFSLNRSSTTLSEDAGNPQNVFTIVLDAQPQGDVSFAITSSDTTRVANPTVQPFDDQDWDTAKGVDLNLTADADSDDNTVTLMMTTTAADAADAPFNGRMASFTINLSDVNRAGIKLSADAVTVAEGATGTWTVQLNTDPGANNAVEVSISSSNAASATASPAEITFTTDGVATDTVRWDTAQDVTVSGETDDDISDNVVIFTHRVTSGTYAAPDANVRVTATDTAEPALMLGNVVPADTQETDSTPTLAIDEGTTRYKYTVGLSHRPNGTVEVLMPNPDPDNLKLSTDRLVFKKDRGDWDRARNIYLDALADGNTVNDTYIITHTASGGGYDELEVVLTLTVEDGGKAGLKLSATNLTLDEGTQGSVSVSLKTQPAADVVVTVGVTGNTDAITLNEPDDPATLTFNAGNYRDTQTVKVTANDDADHRSTECRLLSALTVTSSDDRLYTSDHNDADPNVINRTVNVSVTDTDSAGFSLNRSSTTLSEDAGNPQNVFTIVLDAQPQGDVSFAITSSDTTRVANPTVQPFDDQDWDTAKGVDLNLTADADSDDNTVTLMMTTTAADAADAPFNGRMASFTINLSDVNRAGIKLSADAVTVAEGATGTWTVQLNTDPGANNAVKVSISSSNAASATASPAEITFTTDGVATDTVRWDTAQDVTVSGETDDDISDNVVIFTHRVTSGTYAAPDANVRVTATDTAEPALMLGNVVPADTQETDSTPTLAIDEGTTRYKYTVGLSHRPNGTVEVLMPNPDPDNLKLSTDRLVFKKDRGDWDRARNIYLDALADGNTVNDTYIITHTASGGGYDELEVVLTLTVEDGGKAGLKLSATNLTLDEGTQGSVSVSLKTQPAADVVVTVGVTGNTDAITLNEPDDPATLTFNAGNYRDTQTVKVTANDDPDIIDGLPATVTLNVTSPDDPNYQHNDNDNPINRTVNVSVNDTDSAGFSLNRSSTTLSEDAGNPQNVFTIVLDAQPQGDVSFAITSSDTTRVANPTVQPFDDQDWDTAKGVDLNLTADADSDDNTVTLMMTTTAADAADAPFNGRMASFTINLSDVNRAGIKLSADAVTVAEGATGTWTVQLNTDPGANNAVEVSISSSNAASATVNPEKITFTTDGVATDTVRWDTAQDVTVSGETDDDISDNVVIFTHRVSGGSYAAADATVTVTATDTAEPALMLGQVTQGSPNTLSLAEGADRYQYTVGLSHRPNGTVEILMPNPDPDRLTLSTDRLVFKRDRGDWDRARNIYVTVADDNVMNDDSTAINITHSASGGGYDNLTAVLAVSIIDDDVPGLKLTTTNATVTEGQTVTWDVTLNTEPVGGDVTVAVSAAGTDSDAISVTGSPLTFNAENYRKPQTVTVMAREDPDLVGASAEVTHVASGADYAGISFTVPVTVNDDDSASLVLEGLTNGGLTVQEANNPVTASFMVKLSAQPASTVTVAVTKSGSDDVTIASGDDSLSFSTGDYGTAQEVTINVAADADSNDEIATTIMLTASGAEFAGKTATVNVSVIDDEVPGLRVSTSEVTINQEDGGTGIFEVQLNTPPTGEVTVTIESRDTGAVTVTTPDPATLTFTTANYNLDQRVTLTSVDDDDVGDESVDIVVSSSGANYGGLSTTVKANVTDGDEGTLQFAPATSDGVTVTENSSATYTVRLSHGPNANVTVSLESDNTAIATVSPAKLTFTTGNWQQTQTVTVYGTDDMDADNETTHIKNTATGGGYEITDTNATQMRVTVTDDDQPEIIVSTDKLTVHEGGEASFRVRLKTMPSAEVTVTVTGVTASLTIKSGASLTFNSGNFGTDQTVTVTGVEESAGTENVVDEEVPLTLRSQGGDYSNITTKTVTVTVDDNDTLTYSFGQDSYSEDEGGTVSVVLNLNIVPGAEKVFTLQVLHGGGASTADYSLSGITLDDRSRFQLTFQANETSETISVVIEDDDGLDPGESISFVVIDAAGITPGSPSGTEVRFTDTEPPASN